MSNETQTNTTVSEKTPSQEQRGLRIWLKDFTAIRDRKVKDKSGNTINLDDDTIIEICKGIQNTINTDTHSIINYNGEDRDTPAIFRYWSNGEFAVDRYVGIIIDKNDNQIVIGSRFDQDAEKQYFLQYVFSKAFDENGKIFKNMNPTGRYETTWDLLILFMFIQRLKEAFRKGIFRKYRQFLYNDSNVKGQIDIARYIKLDIPENGKIAYRKREYTPDNYYNILFLRALNEMEKKNPQIVKHLLADNPEVKKTLTILKSSIPEWSTVNIQQVLKNTEQKITHSVYRNYEQLRVISRIILRRLGFNAFNPNKEKAMGILISMPTLWEKFLEKTVVSPAARRLECTYISQGQRSRNDRRDGILILNGKREIKPDFYLEDQKLVLDAKYKNNWKETIDDDARPWKEDQKWDNVREDVFQVMAYMLSLECKLGGVLFPYQYKNEDDRRKKQKDFYDSAENKLLSIFPYNAKKDAAEDRYFFRLPYLIPNYEDTDSGSYHDFARKMQESADKMTEVLESLAL